MMRTQFNFKYIIAISFISALGGYLFGFDFAVISGALPFLKVQFGLNEYWEGFTTGCLALGAIIGCLIAGGVAEKYGRRYGLLTAASIFAISSLGMATANNLTIFIFARFVAGIGVGMASMLSPLYIAEVTPSHIRGRMVAINQLTIVIGILVTNLVNYSLRDNGTEAWRWMFGLGVIPSALFIIGVIWLPESPRWLLQVGKRGKAQKILSKIGGENYAAESLISMDKTIIAHSKISYKSLFGKVVFPAVLIGIGLAVFQQLCGINVVFNYTSVLFESIGFSKDDQLLETVFIGAINLIFTILAMLLVDKLGRKPLMLIGAGGLAILYVIIANLLGVRSANVSWFLLAAIGLYATSLAPVTWVLISEIFPNKVRAAAISVAVLCLWAAYFMLTFTFPILYSKLQDKTFYIYAVVCVAGFLFVWLKVKETKGKTLEEMEGIFTGH